MRGNTGLKTGGDWKLDNVLSWLIAWDMGIPGSCHGHESYFCMYGYSKKKKEADGCRKIFISCSFTNVFFTIVKLLEARRVEKPEHSLVFFHKYVLMAPDKLKACGFLQLAALARSLMPAFWRKGLQGAEYIPSAVPGWSH